MTIPHLDRRGLLCGVFACGCRSLRGLCRVNSATLLDTQFRYSWEVCGSGRVGRQVRGGFWDHLTRGLVPTRSILTTSDNGRLIAVIDSSLMFDSMRGSAVVLCRPDGTRISETGFRINGVVGDCRLVGEESFLVIGALQGGGIGVHRASWRTGEWTTILSLSKVASFSATITTDDVTVLISSQGQVIDATTGKLVALGDCGSISTDRKRLYVRRPDRTPSLYSWPEMQPIRIRYEYQVGSCRQWAPVGNFILLERAVLGVNRLKVVDLQEGTELDVGHGRLTGQSGHAMRWIEWGQVGPEGINRFADGYLSERTAGDGAGGETGTLGA